MTTLSTHPITDPAQLSILDAIADTSSPLGSLHHADFRQACESVADADGWVNPNLVSAWLHVRFGEINPRWYSSQWNTACAKSGFMDTHRDVLAPIDARHSRGNGNKSVPMRKLRAPQTSPALTPRREVAVPAAESSGRAGRATPAPCPPVDGLTPTPAPVVGLNAEEAS